MGAFHRSPSKVWWGDDCYSSGGNFSRSPGSQDSGFSDNDSPPLQKILERRGGTPTISTSIPKDILKGISEDDSMKSQNLSINFKPKSTPRKSLNLHLENQNTSFEIPRTPSRQLINILSKSDPVKRNLFQRNSSLKVSRSLFKRSNDCIPSYQYARDINDDVESQSSYGNNSKVIHDDSYILKSKDISAVELFEANNARPLATNSSLELPQNPLAPVEDNSTSLKHDESFNSIDCESELENAFRGVLPNHTSTPKAFGSLPHMRHRRSSKRRSKYLTVQDHERALQMNFDEEASAVKKWLDEARGLYEPECMTTLQCKSIAAELAQNVACLATRMTNTLRKILVDAEVITTEFANIKGQKQYIQPLAQSIARLVEEFLQHYSNDPNTDISNICNQIKYSTSDNITNLINKLSSSWEISQQDILVREIKTIMGELEAPRSELHVRAALTGLTSIALRNKEINNIFVSVNAIQGLCVLGEKCESSTIRSLVLRGLSTICCDNTAIRQFENASGVQLIADTISNEAHPEPERSEAVALLAQITAPWIEDNNCVRGLHEHIGAVVKSLTNFIVSTNCCQNILLCTAALANLIEMEPKSIKYILHENSIAALLNTIKARGSLISVYLLEQVATLIANISIKPEARQSLTEENVAAALLQFLSCSHIDEDVQQRLQQKSVIALSRLSCNADAARQIVKFDGISKLVLLCRERKERHNSDAVLVAALATLRKIAETCGNSVIDAQDLQELVKPRLLDSFLTYSTQNESYV